MILYGYLVRENLCCFFFSAKLLMERWNSRELVSIDLCGKIENLENLTDWIGTGWDWRRLWEWASRECYWYCWWFPCSWRHMWHWFCVLRLIDYFTFLTVNWHAQGQLRWCCSWWRIGCLLLVELNRAMKWQTNFIYRSYAVCSTTRDVVQSLWRCWLCKSWDNTKCPFPSVQHWSKFYT